MNKHTLHKIGVTLALATTIFVTPSTVFAENNGLATTPSMGWNDWNTFKTNVNEDLIKQTTQALVSSGLSKLGYNYVNIDDAWMAPYRDADGNLVPDPVKFPHGIKALADYVHSLGLKIGIYEDATTLTCQLFPGSYGHYEQDMRQFASWGIDYSSR